MDLHSQWSPRLDELVEETALAINLNGISHAVMMVTPHELDDFAIGFLFAEGIIHANHDVHDLQLRDAPQGLVLEVTLANRCLARLGERKRRLAGATGCGICGVEAIEQAMPCLAPLPVRPLPEAVHLADLRARISPWQQRGQQSGALHAALAMNARGEITACREDIGRHNALDKLIGMQLRQGRRDDTLIITSRCGSELIHKAVRFGAANLISLASPSRLAAHLALEHNLNLIHLPRIDPPVCYTRAGSSRPTGEHHVQSYR